MLPVRVLPVGGGKRIAHCRGCGRSGPVAESSAEALAALRGLQSPFFVGPPIAARGTGHGGGQQEVAVALDGLPLRDTRSRRRGGIERAPVPTPVPIHPSTWKAFPPKFGLR